MEPNSWWISVIAEKVGYNPTNLIPSAGVNSRMSHVWHNNTSPLSPFNVHYNSIHAGLSFIVGDGRNISFWHDEWLEDSSFKNEFPRIYALAENKHGTISDFGASHNKEWIWNIQLRKRLFGWEER